LSFRYHHNVHKSAEENIIKSLEDRGVETRKVQRYDYAAEDPDWADVIVTAGKLDHFMQNQKHMFSKATSFNAVLAVLLTCSVLNSYLLFRIGHI
jgi:galactitol-specific phosphotransferase system IIB component